MSGNEAKDAVRPRIYFDSSGWTHASSIAEGVAESVGRDLRCDEVHVSLRHADKVTRGRFLSDGTTHSAIDPDVLVVHNGSVAYQDFPCSVPLVVNDVQRARLPGDMALMLGAKGVRSCGVFPLYRDGEVIGVVACYYTRLFHRWRADEIEAFEDLSEALASQDPAQSLAAQTPRQSQTVDQLRSQYQRLARHGNIVIITTDNQFRIRDIFGNTESLLGLSAQATLGDPFVWSKIVDPRDFSRLQRRLIRMRVDRSELREEMRFIHQETGKIRWLMLRALPQFSTDGEFLGWEGFGIDVSDKREAQGALIDQNRRLQAVFEVSASLHGYADPTTVIFKGLRAILRATNSQCGYACFHDRDRGELEVVAAVGLSERYLSEMGSVLKGPSLLRKCVDERVPFLSGNLQQDPRAAVALAKVENIQSTIVMPLVVDDVVYGALVLFTRKINSYKQDDLELVVAAASQISLAIRQAEMFEEQRRHTASLNSLYKISHELGKYRSTPDFARHIFPVLQEDFALRRGWLGVLNEAGTLVLGRAGFGPGVEVGCRDIQLEVSSSESILHDVIVSRTPSFIADPEVIQEELVQVLPQSQSLVVVPLATMGQVLGILVVEPLSKTTFLSQEKLRLFMSMANEMATAMMAGRFEAKMAEALKMRMAGLLASGVAHNFNNLLQGILGQVALIEMQTPKGSRVLEATQTITDAAKKGASLVGQLLSFASKGSSSKKPISLAKLLRDSADLYQSFVGRRINLTVGEGSVTIGTVLADESQIQQVLTNILVNAKEAIPPGAQGQIRISLHLDRVRGSELSPDVSPGVYARIDIKDNGIGMGPEQQTRCFEPFFTTKNMDQQTGVGLSGSGLGLATAYSLVRQHDGIITTHSTVGEGTIVSVYLPIFSSASIPLGEVPTQLQSRQLGRGVLLLGVESGVQPFVSSVLESIGYRSRGMFDVRQLTDMLRKEIGEWSVVLLDVDGLGPDALPTCTQLLSDFPELSILCVGDPTSERPSEGVAQLNSERVQFIEKPLSVWSVQAALHKLQSSNQDIVELSPGSTGQAASS